MQTSATNAKYALAFSIVMPQLPVLEAFQIRYAYFGFSVSFISILESEGLVSK
jgi:hypothetical protein